MVLPIRILHEHLPWEVLRHQEPLQRWSQQTVTTFPGFPPSLSPFLTLEAGPVLLSGLTNSCASPACRATPRSKGFCLLWTS